MSVGPYDLSARWVAREESTRACATRLERMLTGLAAIDPAFAHWNKQAGTRAKANKPFCEMPPQIDELTQIFEKGRRYTDIPRELMPDLGYSVSAWNGIDGACGAAFRLRVGKYCNLPDFPNEVELNLPHLKDGNIGLMSVKSLKAVLLTIIGAWEPSWASFTSLTYGRALYSLPRLPPFRSGWMTYLSAPYVPRITPPPSAITEPVAGGGILMLATNEPFTIDNPEHVAVADAIQACLEPLQSDPRLTTATPQDKSPS